MLGVIQLSYKSLMKQRTRAILVILQLFIGVISLTVGIGMIEGSQRYIKNVTYLASTDTLRLGCIGDAKDLTSESLQNFYSYIQNDNRVLNSGSYITTKIDVNNKNRMNAVFVDEPFLDMYNFEIYKGENLSQNNTITKNNHQYIPCLIGYNLSGKYPIGSVFESGIPDDRKMTIVPKKFIVIGILKKDFKFWKGQSTDLSDCIINDDNIIVAPIQEEQNYGEQLKTRISTNTLIKLKNSENSIGFIESIQDEMSKCGLEGTVSSIANQIKELRKQNQIPMMFTLTFAILILLLSSFGLLGVILASIVRRKYEFGIRYTLGSTPRNLVLLILMEILGLYLIASFFGSLFAYIFSLFLPQTILIDIGLLTIMKVFIGTLFLAFISAIIPIINISKLEPVNLIGGKN